MLSRDVQPWKAYIPILVNFLENVMSLRTEHFSKAHLPMLVTESGLFIAASFAHEEKEFVPILVTEEGMTTFSSE